MSYNLYLNVGGVCGGGYFKMADSFPHERIAPYNRKNAIARFGCLAEFSGLCLGGNGSHAAGGAGVEGGVSGELLLRKKGVEIRPPFIFLRRCL